MPNDDSKNPPPSNGTDSGSSRAGSSNRGELRLANTSTHLKPIPKSLSSSPDARSLFKALRRRWFMALAVGLVFAAAAGVGTWYFMPPSKYTARTLIRIPAVTWVGKADATTGQGDQRTHVALIKSRLVLGSALKQPGVADLSIVAEQGDIERQIEWFEKEIQADFAIAPEVLRISMSGDRPNQLVRLVNEVRDAYRREVLDKERNEAQLRLDWLGKQRLSYESRIRLSKDAQRDLEQKTGKDAAARNMKQGFTQQQLNWTERELIQTQSEFRRLRAEATVYKANEKGQANVAVPAALIEDLIGRDSEYLTAQGKVRDARANAEKFKSRALKGDKDPGFAAFSEQIKAAEEALTKLHDQLGPIYEETVKKRKGQDSTLNLELMQARANVLTEDEKILTSEVERLRKEIDDNARNGATLEGMREDMSLFEKKAKQFADDEESQRIALNVPQRNEVVEEGVATRASDSKRLIMAIGIASVGAFGLVCFLVALGEFRIRRVNTVDEVIHGLGMNLVGTIPDSAPRYPRGQGSENEVNSLLSEAVDTTRTMLVRAARAESLQVVMITSAQSGEGKTTLSTHLAASLAQIGHATLLIDGDLRNPIAHHVFGLPLEPGLCELLRGEANLDEVLHMPVDGRPAMIAAGRWDSWATRVLAQDAMGVLLRQLRERFEFIIVDASPVLPVVDPLLLGQHVDGTILSVMRDVSRMPSVYAAHQRLTTAGVRVLGAVVNGVRGELYGATYAYRYGSPAAATPKNENTPG
jgi:polysaccharide biosynthesis transport protein